MARPDDDGFLLLAAAQGRLSALHDAIEDAGQRRSVALVQEILIRARDVFQEATYPPFPDKLTSEQARAQAVRLAAGPPR